MLTSFKHTYLNAQERKAYRKVQRELTVAQVDGEAPEVLIDISDTMCECIEQLAFARYFSERFGLKPTTYLPGFTPKRRALHRLLGSSTNFLLSRGYRLARSHGLHHGFDAGIVDDAILNTAAAGASKFFSTVRSKEDVLGYEALGVKIGIAIYDTYLREFMEATVQLDTPRFRAVANEAFIILHATAEYFMRHQVKMVVLGHCVYNNWKILSDYAQTQNAQVFVTYNSRSIPLHDVNANRGLQTTDHTGYKGAFLRLAPDVQERARAAGGDLLARRVSGELDPGISYMSSSAYAGSVTALPAVSPGKKAIVIMLHSFFDSPHMYEKMVFPDFLEWVHQTLDACSSDEVRSRNEVFVKPHPNRFAAEDALIADILAQYPFAKLLAAETSNGAIAALGPACILTVHGSVAAEFSYLGVPVITCGDNPCSSFGFTFEARTKEEYAGLVRNSDMLKLSPEQRAEVGEFMFMHYLHNQPPLRSYPFERHAPHGRKESHERIGDLCFTDFCQIVDAKLRVLAPQGFRIGDAQPSPSAEACEPLAVQ